MKKHFVTFRSPGTFLSEETTKEIETWDVTKAQKMAEEIKERHNAVPYGFYFTTRERKENALDSERTAQSGMYYLGGTIMTLEEVKARNNPDDAILICNMENNNIAKIVVNTNSWKSTMPLRDEDVVLTEEIETQ